MTLVLEAKNFRKVNTASFWWKLQNNAVNQALSQTDFLSFQIRMQRVFSKVLNLAVIDFHGKFIIMSN